MLFHNTDIPKELIDASLAGSLVIFAGAGISKQSPLCFPTFNELVDRIKEYVDPANRLRNRHATKDASGKLIFKESPEQYLAYLETKGGDVRSACSKLLSSDGKTCEVHSNLIRLFPTELPIKIVTTNFDDAFENALAISERKYSNYSSPALPLGSDMEGIVHLHGISGNPKSMILTADDYGRAYVTAGWASRFLVDLFKSYTVLFVGYSCDDSLVDYLTRSISSEMAGSAFALCRNASGTDDWQLRGIKPILYEKHEDLALIIGEWALNIEQSVTERVHKLEKIGETESLSTEQVDFLMQSLQWKDEDDRALFARTFCNHSNCFDHLHLLHKHDLACFLTKDQPTQAEFALVQWVTARFPIDRGEELQDLLCEMQDRLSIHFYDQLLWNAIRADAPSTAIGPWIAWLENAPYRYKNHCKHQLAHIACNSENEHIVLSVLRALTKVDIALTRETLSGLKRRAIIPANDQYYEEQLIEGLKRHKDSIGKSVFDHCFYQIELAYTIQTGCWTNEKAFDSISFSRSSIEPHEQDRYAHDATDTLLNLARESVSQTLASESAKKCLESECNLLIRLGLWITQQYCCQGDCLQLIAKGNYLENVYLHHETFQLIKSSFAIASTDQKNQFTSYLQQFYATTDESDYACFNMCNWLLAVVEDSTVRKMRSDVLSRNPNYQAREHPDFTHYLTSGIVDHESECKIKREEFTSDFLLERISSIGESQSYITSQDIVSTPARDYPDVAINELDKLLTRKRVSSENDLCRLLISSIEWNSPAISRNTALDILSEALSDETTCISAIEALAAHALYQPGRICWEPDELEKLLLKVEANVQVLLEADSAITPRNDIDWTLVGINHPAGKYLELIAELERLMQANNLSSATPRTLLKQLDVFSLPESPTAKALIACFFTKFNTWAICDQEYSQSAIKALAYNNWAQTPSWQGIARLSHMNIEAWSITESIWDSFFSGQIEIGERLRDELVRLYVWLAIVQADKPNKPKMLKVCGSASDHSLQAACMQIDDYLRSLNERDQNAEWNDWLSDSFEFLAARNNESKRTIASYYCRWIRTFPAIRKVVVHDLIQNCSDLTDKDLFVHDGSLRDVADDLDLPIADKADALIFLLEHQRNFHYEEDARAAASLIKLDDLDNDRATKLQDAFTRCDMSDVAFAE